MKKKDLDQKILDAIASIDDIPSAKAIGRSIGVSYSTILRRFDSNPALFLAAEDRAVAWLDSLEEHSFIKKLGKKHGIPDHDFEKATFKTYEKLDVIISEKIKSFDGIPNATAIARALGMMHSTIHKRFTSNIELREAAETRASTWIDSLEDRTFLEKLGNKQLTYHDLENITSKVYARLDSIILNQIHSFDGIPHAAAIAYALGSTPPTIRNRFDSNPALFLAVEDRAVSWLDSLEDHAFIEKLGKIELTHHDFKNIKSKIYDRLDSVILKSIQSFEGIPSGTALGVIGVNPSSILRRFDSNPALFLAAEDRAVAWLDSLEEHSFLEKLSKSQLTNHNFERVASKIYARLDSIILKKIQSSDFALSASALGKDTGVGNKAIQRRLDSNISLWLALAAKRGLTPDQAVELALERNDQTEAAQKALSQRLQNLHAFREMVGLLRALGHLFTDRKILGVSLYPNPLNQAAQALGLVLPIGHQPMQPFRENKQSQLPKAETVVLQSIHRLPSEGLTSLFQQVYESLAENGVAIATYSMRHAPTEGFLDALLANGFEVTEQGILRIDPPEESVLLEVGVQEDQMSKVQAKLSGSSNVLILSRIPEAQTTAIPALAKIHAQETGHEFEPADVVSLTLPGGLAEKLRASFFLNRTTFPSAPFLVEVVSGKPVALIGFDMHPKQPNSLEVSTYPGSPSEDFHGFARRLARNVDLRKELGLLSTQIQRVPITRIRPSS
jgi:hypothetical protein